MRSLLPLLFIFLAGCSMSASRTVDVAPRDAAARSLAPSGTLRAAINFGNAVLVQKDASGGPRGLAVDLANELGRRLGVPVNLVLYTAAGKVVDGIKANEWDIGFFAIDPVRAVDTDFSGAYVVIEGTYLVREASPMRELRQVDVAGNRVVVATGSAYDLFLKRELKSATLVHAPSSQAVVDTMLAQGAEVAAGVRQQLEIDQKRLPGLRMIEPRFMAINQAMAVPKGREVGLRYLRAFVEEMKSSGFVAASLKRHGIDGAAVAPAAQ